MENHHDNNTNSINLAVESTVIEIRKGQTSGRLNRAEFSVRFRATFIDPSFRSEDASIARLEEIAWQAYTDGRKAPFTQQAGPGYVDSDYKLSVEWMATKHRIEEAQRLWNEPSTPSRVLLICGSARNDGTCPGEMSKSFRLAKIVLETLEHADIHVDLLDLSLITSEYGRNIYPCKGCVSTVIGHVVVIPITPLIKTMTGWQKFMSAGRPLTQ
jgi:hypothetical protein